jgi:hypothetical protein
MLSAHLPILSALHQRSRRNSNRIVDLFRVSGFSKLWLRHLTFSFLWPVTVSGLMRMDRTVSPFCTAIDISCRRKGDPRRSGAIKELRQAEQ